ncbi:MAG: Flp family type IVb pilin [Rhodospirillales bacterium]|nr:Flp family type IVb pilin [Rhodospirillales bacterium]HJO75755.1 Flp family type IVb pilin [Rhodospirillales bacterium]
MSRKIRYFFERLWKQEDGAAAIEYGLIAGLVAIIIITGLTLLGTDLSNAFNQIANSL